MFKATTANSTEEYQEQYQGAANKNNIKVIHPIFVLKLVVEYVFFKYGFTRIIK
jgi:hypothetical protein